MGWADILKSDLKDKIDTYAVKGSGPLIIKLSGAYRKEGPHEGLSRVYFVNQQQFDDLNVFTKSLSNE